SVSCGYVNIEVAAPSSNERKPFFSEEPEMTPTQAMEAETRKRPQSSLTERLSQHPVVAGLTSGILLWSAFPPVEWNWLAWIALVPLFWLAIQKGRPLHLY